jgi:hypothetical protein
MTRSFFQSLERCRVSFLLIRGQATVLYGAAAFSEDIDLWIEPSHENLDLLTRALRAVNARFYKLTPPLTIELINKGHGFHFVLEEAPPVYIDVMGRPPRVGDFNKAKTSSKPFDTEWGTIPVIGLRELVEVKKTQRIEDYPIISRLAVEWLERPECARSGEDFEWALQNIFTVEQLENLSRRWHEPLLKIADGPVADYIHHIAENSDLSPELENEVAAGMQNRMQQFQSADRLYWREIIADLRRLKLAHKLLPNGSPV